MNTNFRKKYPRGRSRISNCNDNKNNFRNQDNSFNFISDRNKTFSDLTTYLIARFLMGNEVQIITHSEKFEGILRAFDTTKLGLSKVTIFDIGSNENFPLMKKLHEFKEVSVKDILQIKMLNINGKLDFSESVIIDQEISQRKQGTKLNLNEDKNLVPYFDEDESQLHSNDDDDDLNTLKGDQNCWYHPEVMLKVNEERFNLKKTFNESMEEYTTQIDQTDPLLKEKVERAERLAKEIENENSMKRGRLLDDDTGEDEELMFSAVVPSSALKSETPIAVPLVKLNPNAPEFRPRQKQLDEIPEPIEEITDNCQSVSLESAQQQQQQHQQQQQQQQQQMFQIHRLAPMHTMPMQPQITPQIPSYPTQRMIHNPQWGLPIPAATSGQYVLQPYLQPNQVIQHMIPGRQMQPEAVQPGSVYYPSIINTQFLIPQDHSLGVSEGTHLYPPNIDNNNQINHTNSLHQLRQSHLLQHIPILQTTNQMSIHHQQQPPQNPQPQQLNAYYPQSQHPQAINPANFQHLIMNQQQQQQQQQQSQLQNGAPIQGYITNGRQ